MEDRNIGEPEPLEKLMIDVVLKLMHRMRMRPVRLEDIFEGNGVTRVRVKELAEYGKPPDSLKGHGIVVVSIASDPVNGIVRYAVPNTERQTWDTTEISLNAMLLDEYVPESPNSSEFRFFVRT